MSVIDVSQGPKWGKVFKNGPSKICGRKPLKIWSDVVCLGKPYHFKFYKGWVSQILLGPFLNTLFQIYLRISTGSKGFHAVSNSLYKPCENPL